MATAPKAIGMARLAAAAMIKLDNEYRGLGEYPFLRAR
jgi:hypothetical protein